jgi:hypothetical protein
MTRHKDLKRIVRNRMKKTGESYTAARAHVIAKAETLQSPVRSPDYATLAGISDARVLANTDRSWADWVRLLDNDNATAMPHREIAAMVQNKHGAGDWWAQMVTVGYERIKGLRERGQRRSGEYEVGKSKTFGVPVKRLFDAWAKDATRRRWLDGVAAVVRTATPSKSMRLQWPDGTIVVVGFTAKSDAKSAVAVQHTKLRDRASSEAARKFWAERLDALASSFNTR